MKRIYILLLVIMMPLMAWQQVNNTANPQCNTYKEYANNALKRYNYGHNYHDYKRYLFFKKQYEQCNNIVINTSCDQYDYLRKRYSNLYNQTHHIFYYNYYQYYENLYSTCKNASFQTGEVCGLVFEDSNANAMFDASDKRLEGIIIKISDSHSKRFTVQTDSNGEFCKSGLREGLAYVNILNSSLPKDYIQVIGTDQTVVNIVKNRRTIEENNGFVKREVKKEGSVCGILFEDVNENKKLDSGDKRLEHITVSVSDVNGKVKKAYTNKKGKYCAKHLPVGRAIVTIIEDTLPEYFVQTSGKNTTVVEILHNQRVFEENNGFIAFYASSVNPKNQLPVSKAGKDYTGKVGDIVHFDGSKSYDSDGDIIQYLWRENKNILSVRKIFNLSTLSAGKHEIELTVTDDEQAIGSDIKIVELANIPKNNAPTADAGDDYIGRIGENVILDASKSYDSDGSIVKYLWSEGNNILGRTQTLSSSKLSKGSHTITLTVTDNDGAIDRDNKIVTISTTISIKNKAPVAHAGDDYKGKVGDVVIFDASKSYDSDGTIVKYLWKEGTKVLSRSKEFNLTTLPAGEHNITVTVTDNDDANASDSKLVTLVAIPQNQEPIAKAGKDYVGKVGDMVLFDASSSYDPDGTIVEYIWREGQTVLSNKKEFNLTTLSAGEHNITLIVIDNLKAHGSDSKLVTLSAIHENQAPVAKAGDDYTGKVEESLTFDASKSYDSDGSIVKYLWKEGNRTLSEQKVFRLSTLSKGKHIITLIVTDDENATGADVRVVTLSKDPINVLPVAVAGEDINITIGQVATLDASSSFDSDGKIVKYTWSTATHSVGEDKIIKLSDLTLGQHIIKLEVTDNDNGVGSDEIIINVLKKIITVAHVFANAGEDFNTTVDANITFDASKSYDVNGEKLEYLWLRNGSVFGNKKIFSTTTLPYGYNKITLIVTNESGEEAKDTLIVNVRDDNLVVVDIEQDDFTMKSTENVLVTAFVGKSNDSLRYEWASDGVMLNNTTAIRLTNLSVGKHVISLTIYTGNTFKGKDSIIVTVVK